MGESCTVRGGEEGRREGIGLERETETNIPPHSSMDNEYVGVELTIQDM